MQPAMDAESKKMGGARRKPTPPVDSNLLQEVLSSYMLNATTPFDFQIYNSLTSAKAAQGHVLVHVCAPFLDKYLKTFPMAQLLSKKCIAVLEGLISAGCLCRFPVDRKIWEGCNVLDARSRSSRQRDKWGNLL